MGGEKGAAIALREGLWLNYMLELPGILRNANTQGTPQPTKSESWGVRGAARTVSSGPCYSKPGPWASAVALTKSVLET